MDTNESENKHSTGTTVGSRAAVRSSSGLTSNPPTSEPVLVVEDLSVSFSTEAGTVTSVDSLSFDLMPGETLGVVGESGSGKSVTSMAVMGLLPKSATITGSIRLRGDELLGKSENELAKLRGLRIAMIFQDALASLNPVHSVGEQLMEAVRVHERGATKAQLRARALELLDTVGIPSPEDRADQYPHEFSGGMRQRIMIAMSIANDPDVLIADEPTTALDVTVQAQVLDVLRRIQERTGSAMLLITHDLGVVAGLADRVLVMYAGKLVEQGSVEPIFYETAHPYTIGLLDSMPRIDQDAGSQLHSIPGMPPKPTSLPDGCRFSPRCHWAVVGLCDVGKIPVSEVSPGHVTACLRLEAVYEARHGGTS